MLRLFHNPRNARKGVEHLQVLSRLFLTKGSFLVLCKHKTLNTKQSEELRSFFYEGGFNVCKIKKIYANMFFFEKRYLYEGVNWSIILTGSILTLKSNSLNFESLVKIFELCSFYEKQNWLVPFLFYYEKRFYSLSYIKELMLKVNKPVRIKFFYLDFFRSLYMIMIIIFLFIRFYYVKAISNAYFKSAC